MSISLNGGRPGGGRPGGRTERTGQERDDRAGSLASSGVETPKVGGTRRPVPLSRSAARSHCRRHRQGSVAIQGYHNPVGDPAANSPGSGIPPLREETQRQGERRKSAETGGEELMVNP